jgi:hypothetical protein
MAIGENLYIQLYSIALEEARHYDRLYTHTWIAGIVFGGAAVATLRFVPGIILGVAIGLGILAVLFFNVSLTSYCVKAQKCRQKAKDIGLILAGRMQGSTSSLQSLIEELTIGPHSALEKTVWAQLRRPQKRWVWLLAPIGIWVVICLFLVRNGF